MTSACAIYFAAGFAVVIFVIVWAATVMARRTWTHVSFSPHKFVYDRDQNKYVLTQEHVSFEDRLSHYLKLAEVIITLASASIVFIPKLMPTPHPLWFAFSMTLFGLCVLFSVLFMVFLTYFYEDSLYMPMNYTVNKSAIVTSLGFTGLLCFLAAYLSIAIQIAIAVGNNAALMK